ncbi:membrane-associating domain-containing protein [Sphaerosporella brunnea]|uniref:Membrane-associating domain-containing protein n=1 Tax=Sphaerosporella brunnea TaxID=1250544 RepID=A0A5J5F1D0_9PEZI|nr:membrane-associating domain-containing protein [Sphaerosporella brunnea]
MAIAPRLLSVFLRAGELICAVIVAGIIGHYIHVQDMNGWWPGDRFIYTEVVAALSMLTALILLVPFTWALTPLPWDFVMFLLWIVSFGLLCDYLAPLSCSWYLTWNPVYRNGQSAQDTCSTFNTALAFVFISAAFWLASFLVGLWVLHSIRRSRDPTVKRRPWYRSHAV